MKARLLNILSFFGSCESPPQDLTTVDGTSIWPSGQQGRRQETHDGPGQRRQRRRTSRQENKTGVSRTSPCACQEKGRCNGAAAVFAAQTLPAATAALALWPAAAVPAWARIRSPKPYPEGGGDRGVAVRGAATGGPTVDREGRSKAASAAASPLVEISF
jgi:hypothetical protein